MPSLSEVLKFREMRFKSSYDLIERKGSDYNRDQQKSGDTLFNLRVCELLGIVPSTEEGILVRLSDKFMRLISLTKPGREAVIASESVLDTIDDIHNYIDYLGLIWLNRRAVSNQAVQAGSAQGIPSINTGKGYQAGSAVLRGHDVARGNDALTNAPLVAMGKEASAAGTSYGGRENYALKDEIVRNRESMPLKRTSPEYSESVRLDHERFNAVKVIAAWARRDAFAASVAIEKELNAR